MKTSAIIIFFVLLGIIFSYPLIVNFNSTIPYAYAPAPIYSEAHLVPGDHLLLYYTYWLLKDYFITTGQNLFREPYMFYIAGWPRPYEPRGLPSSIIFLLFSFLGNAAAYNCLIILSFLLSGVFTFLLAKKYLKDTKAALVSGIIFSVSPFRLTQLFGGHPTGFLLFWIPLIIYLYELLWEKRKWIYGWLAGLCIFLMFMEEHHMGYYTALFTIAFWLYKFWFCNKKNPLNIFGFSYLVFPIACGWIASFAYMMYIKLIVISTSIASGGRGFSEIRLFSPQIRHIFQRINPDGEKCIYMGIIPGILCLLAIYKRLKNSKDLFPFILYFITLCVTIILSLGPNLTYFPLYKLCYKIIPFFNLPRATSRIFMFTLLAISLLSGYGIKALGGRRLLYYISIILLGIDLHMYPRIGLSQLHSGNKTYDYIKENSPNTPLLEIPLWPGESSWSTIYQYYTTIYRIPLINGYSPFVTQQYVNEVFWPLVSINMGMINEEQYNLLKKLNVRYINLHEEAYPQKVNPFPFKIALENLKRSPYIKPIMSDGPMYLFEILDKPRGQLPRRYTIPSKTGIFYECEHMPHRIGTVKGDALSANQKVNEPTHFVFGPWQLFPPGRYKVLFRVKGDCKAQLEVAANKGKTQITYMDLPSSDTYKDYILHFAIDKLTELEFRIIYSGGGAIWADYIYLLCEEENDPVWHYEAEDLFHIGREKDGAVFATPEIDPRGDLIFGPYRRYPEGRYRIGFRIKAGWKSHNESAILKTLDMKQPLKDIPTEYKTYYLDVSLEKPTVLEFQVEFLQEVPIYVDYVEVKPIS